MRERLEPGRDTGLVGTRGGGAGSRCLSIPEEAAEYCRGIASTPRRLTVAMNVISPSLLRRTKRKTYILNEKRLLHGRSRQYEGSPLVPPVYP